MLGEVELDVVGRGVAVVEDRGGEDRIGTDAEGVQDVGGRIGATRGDDGDVDGARHGTGEIQVVARAGAVAVPGCQQDLAGAAGLGVPGPGQGVDARALAALLVVEPGRLPQGIDPRGPRFGVEATMIDEACDGRIIATASAAFRRVAA